MACSVSVWKIIYPELPAPKKKKKELNRPELLTTNHGGGELLLCLDIDCDPGLEVDGEVILEDGDLGDVP